MATTRSAEPEVRLVNSFRDPFDNAVATARTCYSASGIVRAEDVLGGEAATATQRQRRVERRDRLAQDLYAAGHHTTLQHAHFQFALSNVSRHFIWSFLHSHPFYNSEQVSQRYVEVKPGTFHVPGLAGQSLAVYEEALAHAEGAYHRLIESLLGVVELHYYRRFPGRAYRRDRYGKEIRKKAQEVARYVLPVATFSYLYHTISGLTLLRYHRLCESLDAPRETRRVVSRMVEELLRVAPEYRAVLEEPLPLEQTPEYRAYGSLTAPAPRTREFLEEFDASLQGRTSKLIDSGARNEQVVAASVREVLGLPARAMSDGEAIDLVLDPARNPYLGESLRLATHSKLMRALFHARYVFRKKLSHSADSQDQRHRMTPASRPVLAAHLLDEPDYVVPRLLAEAPSSLPLYRESMDRSWEAIHRLRCLGVDAEDAAYLLPNAVAVRFTESADLLFLQHKLAMRLCYNAQDEIFQASRDEAEQVLEVNPRLGRWLLAPCGLRDRASARPICPEGTRFCGEPVWRYSIHDYQRIL